MNIIEEKYEELDRFIRSRVRGRKQVKDSHLVNDIVQRVFLRLLEEHSTSPFPNVRRLWGRTAIIISEETAQAFADSLAVSGVKHQSHLAATRALRAAEGDPVVAYKIQHTTSTSRFGREIVQAVAGGNALLPHDVISSMNKDEDRNPTSLTEMDEDNIRAAILGLPEDEQEVVRMRKWMMLSNRDIVKMTDFETTQDVEKVYQRALVKLRTMIAKSIPRYA